MTDPITRLNAALEGRYRMERKIGEGGMAVVYLAEDLRHERKVALKVLKPELAAVVGAERFLAEIKTTANLQHPHILPLHDSGEADGFLYYVMPYVEGESLRERIDRDHQLPVDEALEVTKKVASALDYAHQQGVVHRDIKPGNILLSSTGEPTVADFGIAKLLGVSGLTQTGSSPGTVPYMSPEQVAGEEANAQIDVWALGVVLYEMLARQLPFGGENQWAVINAISNRTPKPLSSARDDIPGEVERLVLGALEKSRGQRFPSAAAFAEAVEECQRQLAQPVHAELQAAGLFRALLRPTVAGPLLLAALLLGSLTIRWLSRGANAEWAREEAVPEITRLVEGNALAEAFALAVQARRFIPNDPILDELEPMFSSSYSINTTPPGAEVFAVPYGAADDDWEYLGISPLRQVALPRGAYRWRLEDERYGAVSLATPIATVDIDVSMIEAAANPAGMVFVPGGRGAVPLTNMHLATLPDLTSSGRVVDLDGFRVDTYEVTNEQFQEFVDAGGYENREYWADQQLLMNGRELSWEESMAEFIDTTGRPGPATWELGAYPDTERNHPVAGVSWYEAVAYARFRGRDLPTVYHWSRAAFTIAELGNPLGPELVPLSNFDGVRTAPVGQYAGVGPHGTYDMAGNVREWVWNAVGDARLILGGAWSDAEYMFSQLYELPPMDRSPLNGFRTVSYADDGRPPDALTAAVELERSAVGDTGPITPEVYEAYRRQFSYGSSPLEASTEVSASDSGDWTRERITLNAAYADERVVAYLFVPKTGRPPYQTIVYFGGVGPFNSLSSSENARIGEGITGSQVLGALVRTGRAVLWPVYKGSFERFNGRRESFTGEERQIFHREQRIQWYQDLARTLDYLETRDDMDPERVGFLGTSYGASAALPLLAMEERLKSAVLVSGGMPLEPLPPEVDPFHHLPQVTIPVLMLNGSYDYLYPVQQSQTLLFDLLGTPSEQKRHVLYEGGHNPLPRGPAIRESLDWFDEYLGPVN